MTLQVVIVQHADKVQLPGDHGITELGRTQAKARGVSLRIVGPFDNIWCSNLVRTRETAEIIAGELGYLLEAIGEDPRIAERINWWNETEQSHEEFRAEWVRSTRDRDYQPRFGDSSRAAGDRFATFLTDLSRRIPEGKALIVSHGGVTIDLARNLFGDDIVEEHAPGAIEHGMSPCAMTSITLSGSSHDLNCLGVPDIGSLRKTWPPCRPAGDLA